jgi:hypothetical protein
MMANAASSQLEAAEAAGGVVVVEPAQRNAKYGTNMAEYLVDLHDAQATFDFCGGMLFQFVLSDKLREYLVHLAKPKKEEEAASAKQKQPTVFEATKGRMHQLDTYQQSAAADNLEIFHGREIRQVSTAAGGMGFVLQLSLANEQDPEGWTEQEIVGYDGWGHDSGRDWRTGERLEQEGFTNFRERFGPKSFCLHHRFYLHWDAMNRLWLSAEDGCEGTPANNNAPNPNPIQNLFRGLL